jgi:hypothetical protein
MGDAATVLRTTMNSSLSDTGHGAQRFALRAAKALVGQDHPPKYLQAFGLERAVHASWITLISSGLSAHPRAAAHRTRPHGSGRPDYLRARSLKSQVT